MIRSTRNYLNQQARRLWRIYARLRRASLAADVIFYGRPLIRCVKSATLRFESGVRVNSNLASNPIMMRTRSTFCCVAPGARILIERDVGMSSVSITAAREVIVGEGTLLGADCLITDTDFHIPIGNHRWGNNTLAGALPIRIGRGCFIGARAIILKGVTIGDGAVIAAGAVVTKNVAPEHMAAGNPAFCNALPARWCQSRVDIGTNKT
jgi:acetyltransferase-like isoleucine patch superfamily enzyme